MVCDSATNVHLSRIKNENCDTEVDIEDYFICVNLESVRLCHQSLIVG